jgi:hypothetical protein
MMGRGMSEEKLLGRYQMLWDCSFCGASKLLALDHRHCPECGAPQDQTKRYFPPDGEKKAVADDYAGTDRTCPHCKHANGAKATFCVGCGAPLDEAAAVKKRSDQVVKQGQQFLADDAAKAEAELGDKPRPKPAPKKKSRTWLYVLLGVAGLIFLIWFMCIRKRSADFEVAEQRWRRSIAIEEYREVEEETWKHQLPSGARTLRCRDKTYETKKVPDGQDCQMRRVDKGDGTFEERQECTTKYRDEPIERPWCTYLIFRWKEIDRKVAETDDGGEPAWPATGVTPGPQQAGARREGERQEVFELDLVESNGKKHTCAVGQALWKQAGKGAALEGEVRARSGEIVCSSLKAK